jgi:hypothetical protein
MKMGRAGTPLQTSRHDHAIRALNVLDGTVIGRNMQRHRLQEFIRSLNAMGIKMRRHFHQLVNQRSVHRNHNDILLDQRAMDRDATIHQIVAIKSTLGHEG